eukprot:jgi/Chlat1/5953/Chrsp4S06266
MAAAAAAAWVRGSFWGEAVLAPAAAAATTGRRRCKGPSGARSPAVAAEWRRGGGEGGGGSQNRTRRGESSNTWSSSDYQPPTPRDAGEHAASSSPSEHATSRSGNRPFNPPSQRRAPRDKPAVRKAAVAARGPTCYGCGAPLQVEDGEAPGFVKAEVYQQKQQHHQLGSILCGRCTRLCHGELVPAVGGHGGHGSANSKTFVTAEQLREQLLHLKNSKALIVKLVDLTDFHGSFVTRVRDIVGANPILLVGTKADLLPREADLHEVENWALEVVRRKKLNVVDVRLVSAKTGMGMEQIARMITTERQGRDVYILGAANAGKSAFVHALLKDLAKRDPAAIAASKRQPVQSAMPGTTLGPIAIDAFGTGSKLYDTPGLHLHHRLATALTVDELQFLVPRGRFAGVSVGDNLAGTTYLWSGVVRVDVIKAPPSVELTFFGPDALPIKNEEGGTTLVPPLGPSRYSSLSISPVRDVSLLLPEVSNAPAADVAISGLGWIRVGSVRSGRDRRVDNEVVLRVWAPKGVEVFLREPMPVEGLGGVINNEKSFRPARREQERQQQHHAGSTQQDVADNFLNQPSCSKING